MFIAEDTTHELTHQWSVDVGFASLGNGAHCNQPAYNTSGGSNPNCLMRPGSSWVSWNGRSGYRVQNTATVSLNFILTLLSTNNTAVMRPVSTGRYVAPMSPCTKEEP